MILRILRGRLAAGLLDAFRDELSSGESALGREPSGALRFHAGVRPVDGAFEFATIACRSSSDTSPVAEGEAAPSGIRIDEAELFEIDQPVLRDSVEAADPVAIRIATGRFSRHGSHIEMLHLLRERAPLLGGEMVEAYVGRRLHAGAVEVTFVSVWLREPVDRALRSPFWPDIALKYDEFKVGVYAPLGRFGRGGLA